MPLVGPKYRTFELTGGARTSAKKTNAIRRPVQRLGTPGMGVIVMGWKSPVRDWET